MPGKAKQVMTPESEYRPENVPVTSGDAPCKGVFLRRFFHIGGHKYEKTVSPERARNVRADGNPRFAMLSTLTGAAINIVLDPIFIFVLRWGMMGAAIATVMGQAATAAIAMWYLFHTRVVTIHRHNYAIHCPNMKL